MFKSFTYSTVASLPCSIAVRRSSPSSTSTLRKLIEGRGPYKMFHVSLMISHPLPWPPRSYSRGERPAIYMSEVTLKATSGGISRTPVITLPHLSFRACPGRPRHIHSKSLSCVNRRISRRNRTRPVAGGWRSYQAQGKESGSGQGRGRERAALRRRRRVEGRVVARACVGLCPCWRKRAAHGLSTTFVQRSCCFVVRSVSRLYIPGDYFTTATPSA